VYDTRQHQEGVRKEKEMVYSPLALPDEQELEMLTNQLHLWGINYLTGSNVTTLSTHQKATTHDAAVLLIQRLVCCKDARIRDACVSLLLLHPDLADSTLTVLQTTEATVAKPLTVLVLATLYLQRLWSVRLTIAFGHPSCFPETPFQHLWQQARLPSPACHFGIQGLLALQMLEQQRIELPVNVIGDWQNQIQHLLMQEEKKQFPLQTQLFPLVRDKEIVLQEQECDTMSMRPTVDKAEIERFLHAFGQFYRKQNRLYLTGGAALVHAGIRSGRTLDIDVEVTDGDMLLTIDQLKQRLQLNIEVASPKDFMPVPNQWETWSQYVGRYGSVDVFYFDFYSIALSKIDRGTTRDLQDVQLLVLQSIIDLKTLDIAFQEVIQQVQSTQGRMRYPRFDPTTFATRYHLIKQQLLQP